MNSVIADATFHLGRQLSAEECGHRWRTHRVDL